LTPELLKQFEDAHPGVKLNVVADAPCCSDPSAGLPQHLDNLQRYASSADVLYEDNIRMSVEGTRAGYFLDLAPLVAADKTLNSDDFYPVAQRAYQWDQGVWALPVSLEPMILSYNPDAFDKIGLAYPNDKWTLDDLANAARKLSVKRADGTVTQVGMSAPQVQFLFRSLLTTGFSDDSAIPNMPHFATPEVAAVLDAWLKLDTEGIVTSNFIDRPPLGITQIEDVLFQSKNPDQKRAGSLLPGGKSFIDTIGFAVSAGTTSPELAYELAAWLTTRGEVADYLALLPARKSLRDSSVVGSGSKGGKGSGLSQDAIQFLDSAITNGLSYADLRFQSYVIAAYNRAKANHIQALDALQHAESDALKAQQDAAAKKPTVKASLTVATPVPQAPLAPGKVALKFVVSTPHVAGKPPNQALWNKVIQDFTASDPQVGQIALDWSPDDNLTRFASSYDCFFIPANQVPAAPLNSLISLDPFMAADKSFDKSDFLGNALAAVQRDGKTYAFPLGLEPMILQVSADQLMRAGLSVPSNGWTANSFIDVLHKLKQDASDPAPVDTSRTDGTHLLVLMTAFGGLPLDYRTTPPTINFTDPATVAAMRQALDLARQGFLQYSRLGVLPPAQRGPAPVTAPIFSDTVNNLSAVAAMKMGITDKYQPMLYPKGSQFNGLAYNVEAAYINAQTTYPEACYRWISTLSQHPELFWAMPARHSQVTASALKGTVNPALLALYSQVDALFSDPHTVNFAIPDPQNTSVSDYLVRYWLYKAFDSYVLDGKDLDSALKDAENDAKGYQTCAANLPDKVIGSNSPSAFQPYINCAERVDPSLKPTFDQLLASS
jgi:ABC-type glycerol-3-phosphate transport system substrate-binding protein